MQRKRWPVCGLVWIASSLRSLAMTMAFHSLTSSRGSEATTRSRLGYMRDASRLQERAIAIGDMARRRTRCAVYLSDGTARGAERPSALPRRRRGALDPHDHVDAGNLGSLRRLRQA